LLLEIRDTLVTKCRTSVMTFSLSVVFPRWPITASEVSTRSITIRSSWTRTQEVVKQDRSLIFMLEIEWQRYLTIYYCSNNNNNNITNINNNNKTTKQIPKSTTNTTTMANKIIENTTLRPRPHERKKHDKNHLQQLK